MKCKSCCLIVISTICWTLVSTSTCEQSNETFVADYIVVGAGSAGSVVANRLSADEKNKVILLEAGEWPNLMSEVPNFYSHLQNTKYDWNFTVSIDSFPLYNLSAKEVPVPQGKVLGGSSAINGMIYARGNRFNYDNWARDGAKGWDWNSVLPLFKKSENNQDPDIAENGFHGKLGEMYVQRPSYRTSMAAKYIEAVKELGYQVDDVNGPNASVFMNPQLTVHNGRRWGSHNAFLKGIIGRRNLRVLTSAYVRKVLFNGSQAIGVEVDYKEKTQCMFAKKEVILSAGAVKSPQILMLSGVGPKHELEKFKIPVISDLPVGKNFHDHPLVVAYTKMLTKLGNLTIEKKDYDEFLSNGRGILSDISSEVIGFVNSNVSKSLSPDIEIIFLTLVDPRIPGLPRVPISGCVVVLVSPRSRGKITLKTDNPYDHPRLEPKYLNDEEDLKAIEKGIQVCRTFGHSTNLSQDQIDIPIIKRECLKYLTKGGFSKYNRCVTIASASPGYHLGGTCKMGDPNNSRSVVDPELRVIGVKGLRVIDNSIIPEMPSGHPHAAAVMIGEKGSISILKDAK